MRVGWNPVKRMRRHDPLPRVALALVTHIPFLEGFYAESLDVLQLALASLRAHTAELCDLWVFDNASCEAARACLLEQQAAGSIDFLILSTENVGILGAHNALFAAVPNEFIAYADSDIYFRPGWLEACLQVLEAFPQAGLVTALPVRNAAAEATGHTLAWAQAEAEVRHESGRLIPEEWIAEFCAGTGRELQRYLEEWQGQADHRLTYRGVRAYAGASTFQFVARRAVLQQALPLPSDWLLHGAIELLARIDAAGCLSLATDGAYVYHLGNTLTEKWRAEAQRLGLNPASRPLPDGHSLGARLARWRPARRVLFRVYDTLFRLLYGTRR